MKTKSLSLTNPYMRNSKMRRELVQASAISSCAVEGITYDPQKSAEIKIISRGRKKIYQSKDS